MEQSLAERDKKVIWHPYTPQKYAPDPIPVVKGEGVYLIDTEGKSYVDAISSWWVNLHGHAHPYIAGKIYEQAKLLEQVIFAGFTHQPAVELAEKILQILPGNFSKIFYSDNGSTAVEVAVKMAIQFWWNLGSSQPVDNKRPFNHGKSVPERNKILALKNSYHGDTFGAMSVSDRGIFTLAFQDKLFDVVFIDPADIQTTINNLEKGVVHYNSPGTETSTPGTLTVLPEEIACFIYEPLLQAAGGMKIYESKPLNGLIGKLQEFGIICIADEVMTGFGRTGKLFASGYIESKPDIICLSKGLTGGSMALGVTACSSKIHDAFISDDKLKTFFHGHSYTANPLACTAALASLDLLLNQACIDSIDRIGHQHRAFAARLQGLNTTARTKNHRFLGTILAFEIESGQDDYLNNLSNTFTKKALSKGVFLRPLGNTVYIMPPYCISESQLQTVYDVIVELLDEM